MEQQKAPAKKREPMRLRSVSDLTAAHEWLFSAQRNGEVDSKTADALNTTLKGCIYLNVKLKIDVMRVMLQAQVKKVAVPEYLLPEGLAAPSVASGPKTN